MKYPLMKNNILRSDLDHLIKFLKKKDPILTQSKNVKLFEKRWSSWLGVKYSVFVNSGSSANLLSIGILKTEFPKGGEIIVPTFTWVSDIVSLIHYGFTPVFVDIDLKNLSMNEENIFKKINKKTRAVFLTHAQGFNGLSDKILKILKQKKIYLIEDVCESHGASFKNKKLGSFGYMSNFSFYYAHHMSTIEGGMICTNNKIVYEKARMLRSHGLVREINDNSLKKNYIKNHKDLNPQFIFALPGLNVRNNELGAILGINQLKRLNFNIKKRNQNHNYFLKKINKSKFYTEFDLSGSSNYAFNLIMREKDINFANRLMKNLTKNKIEFRRGSVGGGNQLRQPYLKTILKKNEAQKYPVTEHIHFFGFYIGNYPELNKKSIDFICKIINKS
tara:strand:+ start:212 stop:1381 length:1170 start_codon:yes stop_codon:yes gene_type:complete